MSIIMVTRGSGIASLPSPRWDALRSPGHSVQFYLDDSFLLEGLGRFIGAAIASGDAAVVIATKDHREKLARQLKVRGLDLALAAKQGRYLSLDAAETLAKFMVNGRPDAARFSRVIGNVIAQLASPTPGKHLGVAAFGEMVALLWKERKADAAIRVEQLWNDLGRTHSFHLHCAYSLNWFSQEQDARAIAEICEQHSQVIPAETYTDVMSEEERLRSIVFLQQKARALETEILERKQADEARLRLAAIVESSDDAIASKDLNGVVTSWNASAEHIFGYTAKEIVGRPITVIIPPELQNDEQVILGKMMAGERIDHFETVRLTKSGERIDVSLTISPIKDERGKIIGAAKVARDITQRKKMEMALRTAEKLASVGRLAATVAHEINNPLEAVTNFIYLAKVDPALPEHVRGYMTYADQELARVSHLVRQTLGFYRDSSAPAPLLVADVIRDVLITYERKFQYKELNIEERIEPGLTMIASQGELNQILSNLIANAIDASKEGGKIVIAARTSRHYQSGRAGIRITVADNGAGMSADHKRKLFVPFFTTKQAVGTGLGLWITKDLLEKKGGQIRFRSTDQTKSGTVMSIFLP